MIAVSWNSLKVNFGRPPVQSDIQFCPQVLHNSVSRPVYSRPKIRWSLTNNVHAIIQIKTNKDKSISHFNEELQREEIRTVRNSYTAYNPLNVALFV